MIDFFGHTIDLIEQARKNFRPRSTDDEAVLAEQPDYVWDPEWSYELFIKIPTDISSQAVSTISINKDYVRLYPLTADATSLNYNSFFPERTANNSLNSKYIKNDNLNGTRNLTHQNIQTPSRSVNEEIVETITTEAQRSISPIQPSFITSKLKKTIVTTNSHTIHSKTFCCTEIFTNGLLHVSTSNKTIIQTTQKQFCRT